MQALLFYFILFIHTLFFFIISIQIAFSVLFLFFLCIIFRFFFFFYFFFALFIFALIRVFVNNLTLLKVRSKRPKEGWKVGKGKLEEWAIGRCRGIVNKKSAEWIERWAKVNWLKNKKIFLYITFYFLFLCYFILLLCGLYAKGQQEILKTSWDDWR